MSKVLYIKANPKSNAESRTYRISEAFVQAYKDKNPNDEIVTLDLYEEDVDFLSHDFVTNMHKPSPAADRSHPVLKYAYQFKEADKYIIAEPLWNLSIPAKLKAYIDYITVAGVTFAYTADGPKGLCQNKKAVNITSRGGAYLEGLMSSFEMGDRYLRTILGFLGITDFATITAENLDIVGADVETIVGDSINQAKQLAMNF